MVNALSEAIKPNEKQKLAIDTLTGPVMLLAGPGTGKTFTLVRRIENMLNKGIEPESILCLAFSEAASAEMKERVIKNIGAKASAVNICTYHSFCMDVIRCYPDEFEMTQDVQMADEVTKTLIVKESIDEFGDIQYLKNKWGDKYFHIDNIIDGIEVIKKERTTQEAFEKYIQEVWIDTELKALIEKKEEAEAKNRGTKGVLNDIEKLNNKIGKAREFWQIYQIYRRKMAENNLIDYSDMINFVLDKMEEDESFLKEVTKNYKYILVDEYQDTSTAQNDLIFNIVRGTNSNNIFVVGDDDQIIYTFQGAKSRNLLDFIDKYKNAEIICLEENNRSSQTILDFAQGLIEQDTFRIANLDGITKKLTAKNKEVISKEEKIKYSIFLNTIQEANNICNEIEQLIKKRVKPSEIAILARQHNEFPPVVRLLKQKNIPYSLGEKKDAFSIPSFIQAYFYLKTLTNTFLEQDKLLGLLTYEPFKIEDKTLAKILRESRINNENLFETIKKTEECRGFIDTWEKLKARKSFVPFIPYIYEVLTESGILKYFANNGEDRFENIKALERLISEATSFANLHKTARLDDFVKHLDAYTKQGSKLIINENEEKKDAIKLLTYHASKGREFEHVFMMHLTSNAFDKTRINENVQLPLPIKKSAFSEDKDLNTKAQNLRLLFVGITRSKFGLHLSYSMSKDNVSQNATKYIADTIEKNSSIVETRLYNSKEISETEELENYLTNTIVDCDYINEIDERINNLVMSQTLLNEYINCPLSFFYGRILNVPVYNEDKDILHYGSAMHKALEVISRPQMIGKEIGTSSSMLDQFLDYMNKQDFTTDEKKQELIERGRKSIEENYPSIYEKLTIETPVGIEEDLNIDNFRGIKITGKADRITKDKDGNIHIYDFKTGSHKSKTVKEDNPYYRQLRLYKLLYETKHPKEKVLETSLIYIEENCKTTSPIEKETSDNQEIIEILEDTYKKIKSHNFEPDIKNIKEDNCAQCKYSLICKLNKNK